MESEAVKIFEAGLARAEEAYAATFKKDKGGFWTWATTWGSDWETLIKESLEEARKTYEKQVDIAINEVATYVDAQLAAAKQAVADGRNEVETFVHGLDQSVKEFGDEALQAVSNDFDALDAEIDKRRDGLLDKLTSSSKPPTSACRPWRRSSARRTSRFGSVCTTRRLG